MRFDQLPHKILIYSAAAALAIFMIGYFFVNNFQFNRNNERLIAQNVGTSTGTAVKTDLDSDGDSLPDWEERLYGSDIHNADSDGDGVNDGTEVKEGRNPIKKGPNDKLEYLQDPNFATSTTDISGIKKEFFASYLAERSREIQEQTMRDLVKSVDYAKFRPKHQLVNLRVSSDNSDEGVRAYVNEFGKLIKKYTARVHRTEDEILADVMKTKNQAVVNELDLPAITYQNFTNDLRDLSVPIALAQAHLLIVNGYEGMSKGILGIKNLLSNPIEGAAGFESYNKYRVDVVTGYAQIVAYVGSRRLVFTEDEPGYPFYWNTVAGTSSPDKVQ